VSLRLEDLRPLRVNYDPEGEHRPEDGWRIDDYCRTLAHEPPGDPVPGGPFEAAQGLLRNYQVADPGMVRATYDPDSPLEGRDMLLEIRFLFIRVRVGCRVGDVTDEQRTEGGRPVRVWGWAYQTLEGHIEQGQMSWEVWKWLDTGEVQFRIHSYMRNAENVNPVLNLGFKIVGQRERRRYLTTACDRMERLTREALRGEEPSAARSHEPV
jgi:uncharacterized protein (UPF0548 family)